MVRWPVCPIISHLAPNPSAGKLFGRSHAGTHPVGDRVGNTSLCERPQTQETTIANAACLFLTLVTRPGQMKRRAQFQSAADDLAFLKSDNRCDDFDFRFRPRPPANQLLKRFVIFGSAIRISRTVFGDRSDVKRTRAGRFRPTDADAQKMGVAERNVGYRN